MYNSLRPHDLQAVRFLYPWNVPVKDIGVGCHFLLQGIFPMQGLNPHLLLGRWILYHCATWEAVITKLPTKEVVLIHVNIGKHLRISVSQDGGAWQAAVHGVARSRTLLSDFTFFSLLCTGEGNGNPLQCSCLENPRDGGAWQAAVHGVARSRTRLSDFTFTFHFYALEKEMATHSSVLAWRIPGMGEPGGLLSMGSHRVGHD